MDILDPDSLLALVGEPTPKQKAEVEAKVLIAISNLQALNPQRPIMVPEITYDLKGRTAGEAYPDKIRINLDILNDPRYYQDMLNQTIPHEVCHVVQMQWYPHSKAHGYEWGHLMLCLGLQPERCHQYETKVARKVERPFIYACDCREHRLTNYKHNKIDNGAVYYCKRCRGTLHYIRTED